MLLGGVMEGSNSWMAEGTINDTRRRFDEYKEVVSRLFPALPRDYVDAWSISTADALALAHFLECYPRKVVVLDIGTSVGVSAFHFASQPKVLRVISLYPNSTTADKVNDKSDVLGSIYPEPLRNLRVLEVARAALAEFDDEQQKIQLCAGIAEGSEMGLQGSSIDGFEKIEMPALEPSNDVSLVAFVDGLHTKEGVRAHLEAIFEKNPHALVLLHDCRGYWGPFVQAGTVSFMEQVQEKYHFQLFGDLSPGVATSPLGIVYPDIVAAEVKQTLVTFSELFSERLDLLRLLRREEELIAAVGSYTEAVDGLSKDNSALAQSNKVLKERNSKLEERNSKLEERNSKLKERNSKLEERNSKLEERNSKLIARYSSRRYKLTDTLSEGALQVSGLRKLLVRRKAAQ